MNPIAPKLIRGTIGELLVQLRLLQFGVQAAQPLKDSGNDLIAIRRSKFRAIQVKTTASESYRATKLPKLYDLLAVVHIRGSGPDLYLDDCRIYLIPKERVPTAPRRFDKLDEFILSQERVDELFHS
jgi:hypothetical protein